MWQEHGQASQRQRSWIEEYTPQFSAPVSCGQMTGWIKMPLGTKVGLSPDHIVLNRDPASPIRGTNPRNFQPMSIVAKWSLISATAEHLSWFSLFIVDSLTISPVGHRPRGAAERVCMWQQIRRCCNGAPDSLA